MSPIVPYLGDAVVPALMEADVMTASQGEDVDGSISLPDSFQVSFEAMMLAHWRKLPAP